MRSLYDDYKLSEMLMTTRNPAPPRGTLGAASNPPVFLDESGRPITSIVCGGTYTFDVPGYGAVWLTMTKNGQQVFNQMFTVPMAPYTSTCANDVGTYQLIAYDPVTGMVIGQTQFTVLPAGSSLPGTSFLSSLTTAQILIGAGAILFFFSRRK